MKRPNRPFKSEQPDDCLELPTGQFRAQMQDQHLQAEIREAEEIFGKDPKDTWDDESDRLVAYHEAGHAVARFINGLTIRSVTIGPAPSEGGYVLARQSKTLSDIPMFPWPLKRRWMNRASRTLDIICAGPAVSSITHPPFSDDDNSLLEYMGSGHGSDLGQARVVAALISRAYRGGRGVPSEEQVMEIVEESFARIRERLLQPENWVQVEALAKHLLQRRTLSGRDAKAICGETAKAWRPDAT